jgi:hypothetical protein
MYERSFREQKGSNESLVWKIPVQTLLYQTHLTVECSRYDLYQSICFEVDLDFSATFIKNLALAVSKAMYVPKG